MRTAIIFGAYAIADAIRIHEVVKEAAPYYGTVVIVLMTMDIIDFFKKG